MLATLLILMFIGSFAQRVTGLGFGLLVAPFIVLLLGPYSGVMVLNLAAMVSASLVLATVWRDVEWRRFAGLVPGAIAGILAGSVLAHSLPTSWLEAGIGALLIASLTISLLIGRTQFVASGPAWVAGSGLAAGAMNAAAGIGGPALTVYSVLSRWPQRSFSATLQPFFLMTGAVSFIVKYAIDPERLVDLSWVVWVVIIGVILAGVALGNRLAHLVPSSIARSAVLVMSYAGGVITLGKGLIDVFL